MINNNPLFAETCLVCDKIDYYCECQVCWSPNRLGGYNTDDMVELYDQMTGIDRWPDGRNDKVVEWLAKELYFRGRPQKGRTSDD
jgi:hypothetical protein